MPEVNRRNAVKASMTLLPLDDIGTLKTPNICMIKNCATGSIAFGAPAFNKGDRMACFRFYYNTVRSLVKTFRAYDPTYASYPPSTRTGISYLEEALLMCKMDEKRVRHENMNAEFKEDEESPSRHAWRLRFAFDRSSNLWKVIETNFSALKEIAGEYFRRFQLEEAAAALKEAAALLDEICYDVPARYQQDKQRLQSEQYVSRFSVYFDLVNLHFAMGEFEEAIKYLKIGQDYLPDTTEMYYSFPLSSFKRRDAPKWTVVTAFTEDLKARVEKEASNKDLAMLYEWITTALGQS